MSFSFFFSVMKWKEYFCLNPKLCLGKVLVQLSYRLNHPLFLWTTIFLWMKYDRWIMVIPTWLLIKISKNNWHYLLPMITYELPSKNWNLESFFCDHELDSFLVPKTFLMRLMNVIFWYCKIKCVKIWETFILTEPVFPKWVKNIVIKLWMGTGAIIGAM